MTTYFKLIELGEIIYFVAVTPISKSIRRGRSLDLMKCI